MNKNKEILEEKDATFGDESAIRVIVSKEEYAILRADSALLDIFFANGVDNWEGYSDSVKTFRKKHE